MTRLCISFILVMIAGCARAPAPVPGDLTPYLTWPEGTPVVVYLAARDSEGEIVDGVTSRGTLISVTRDEIRIRSGAESESIGYVSSLVRRVEVDRQE